jgi:macrolide transport system ATP-binding/permease protein
VKSRLYRALIRVLPFDFRREFGEEMAGVFDDQRVHAQGVTASARLWAGTLGGVLRLAPREHLAILRQDIAYAFRVLRRSPTFTVSAILALALGIGANTAVFSLANAVLLNPLPVANPGRLVSVLTLDRQNPGYSPLSTDNFRDFRARTETLSGAAAFTFLPVRLLGGSESQEAFALAVTGEYFDVLGVRAIAGRTFGPEEDRVKGGSSVVVLTHRLWTTRFGSDRGVIGSTVRLNGQPFTVIGVAPPRFNGTYGLFGPDLFVPFMMYDALAPGAEWFEGRRIRWLNIVARLAPGVSLEQARADAAIQGDRLAKEFPRFNEGRTFTLLPLAHAAINPDRHDTFVRAGWLLAAVVGVVLLVACANLANLLLARAASRSREVAVRLALGASRGKIVRQLVTESLMLGLAGGGAGLALAWWTQRWLWSARPANLQQAAFSLSLDGRILLFTLGVSILAGLAFGLLPAVQVSRSAVNTTLKESGRAPSTASRPRLRAALVIGEVALSIVALTAAGLLLRSLSQAQRIDPGFAVDRGAVMFYNAGGGGYDVPRARGLHEQLLDRLRADPGVRGAALTARPPLSQGEAHTINVTGQAPPPGALGFLVEMSAVSPGYFGTMGIPIVSGRDFDATDRPGSRPVAVINETMARRFWPDRDPIGQHFQPRNRKEPIEVIGVARDSKYITLGEDPAPFFYAALWQQEAPSVAPVALIVSTRGEGETAAPIAREAMRELDREIPFTNIATLADVVDQALWAPRTVALLVTAFGALALGLAAIGLYGVLAYSVSQRRQEIGLRMALGAAPRNILAMIVGRGLLWTAIGAAAGLGLALLAASGLSSLLYGVEPSDPTTFIAAPIVLLTVAFVASYFPARRAARLDPSQTLRS